MELQEIDRLVIDSYFNITHGLELTPDINIGERGNENGIVYLASYLMMRDMVAGKDQIFMKSRFNVIYHNCLKEKNGNKIHGLLNRGRDESDFPPNEIRGISHDNISAFTSIDRLINACPNGKGLISRQIYKYGLKNLFVYNNRGVKFDLPMNPGNYALWAYNGGSKVLWLLTLPFLLINLIITLNKPYGNTSGKILGLIELYPNRNDFIWNHIWKYYEKKMVKQYGDRYLEKLMGIYFLPLHPNNLIAKLVKK